MPEKPPPIPPAPNSEERFAFVTDLETEPWPHEWSQEVVERCKVLLQRLGWSTAMSEEHAEELFRLYRTASEEMLLEDKARKARTVSEAEWKIVFGLMQRWIFGILRGHAPRKTDASPTDIGTVLEHMLRIRDRG